MTIQDQTAISVRTEHGPEVSALSRRLRIPMNDVGAIYAEELLRLAADARIKTFLNVLALRNTKGLLRNQFGSSAWAEP